MTFSVSLLVLSSWCCRKGLAQYCEFAGDGFVNDVIDALDVRSTDTLSGILILSIANVFSRTYNFLRISVARGRGFCVLGSQ